MIISVHLIVLKFNDNFLALVGVMLVNLLDVVPVSTATKVGVAMHDCIRRLAAVPKLHLDLRATFRRFWAPQLLLWSQQGILRLHVSLKALCLSLVHLPAVVHEAPIFLWFVRMDSFLNLHSTSKEEEIWWVTFQVCLHFFSSCYKAMIFAKKN